MNNKIILNKVVLPVAGLGTRLLTVTKEQPKEMLPVFAPGNNKQITLNPIIQLIFEQLFENGFKDFCFIVGKNKRIIEDHFTADPNFLNSLISKGKKQYTCNLKNLFDKIEKSTLIWINQSQPLGFGHAVLQARPYAGNERFLLHAGDTLILSKKNSHIKKLIECHMKNKADASFIVQEITDPRHYGVIDGKMKGDIIRVTDMEEKPIKPKTNLAIMPVYIFEPIIFDYLKKTKPKKLNEIQLTDAILQMVKDGLKVYAINLTNKMIQMDIGNPESYWDSLKISREFALSGDINLFL